LGGKVFEQRGLKSRNKDDFFVCIRQNPNLVLCGQLGEWLQRFGPFCEGKENPLLLYAIPKCQVPTDDKEQLGVQGLQDVILVGLPRAVVAEGNSGLEQKENEIPKQSNSGKLLANPAAGRFPFCGVIQVACLRNDSLAHVADLLLRAEQLPEQCSPISAVPRVASRGRTSSSPFLGLLLFLLFPLRRHRWLGRRLFAHGRELPEKNR
jgi:hypothetical protein